MAMVLNSVDYENDLEGCIEDFVFDSIGLRISGRDYTVLRVVSHMSKSMFPSYSETLVFPNDGLRAPIVRKRNSHIYSFDDLRNTHQNFLNCLMNFSNKANIEIRVG